MKHTTIFIFLFISVSLFSQKEIIYDLDSYKQVVFKRSSLVLSPNGGLTGYDNVNVEGAEADFMFKLGATATHNKYINSADEQYSLNQRVRSTIEEGVELFAARKVTKRTYSNDNRYIKLGYDSEATFDSRSNQLNNFSTNYKNLRLVGDLGLGFGRIEYINHAWSAVQILQALENQGLLLRIPSHDEISKFANIIGKVRTDRIMDFRLRNIEILETTINYLIEEKLIDQLSTMAILIIGDTYQYDQITNRNSGSRLEFTLAPKFHITINNSDQNYAPNKSIAYGSVGRIDYISYENIDVKWMKTRSRGAILDFNYNDSYYDGAIEPFSNNIVTAGLTYSYGYRYLPNLRNNFNLNLGADIFMDAYLKENTPIEYSSARLALRLQTEYNHYFSPATQFSVTGYLNYNDAEFQSGDYQPWIYGQLYFTLSQAIF